MYRPFGTSVPSQRGGTLAARGNVQFEMQMNETELGVSLGARE